MVGAPGAVGEAPIETPRRDVMGYETRERIRVLKELGRSERSAGEIEAARSLFEEAVLLCRAEGHVASATQRPGRCS